MQARMDSRESSGIAMDFVFVLVRGNSSVSLR